MWLVPSVVVSFLLLFNVILVRFDIGKCEVNTSRLLLIGTEYIAYCTAALSNLPRISWEVIDGLTLSWEPTIVSAETLRSHPANG